MVVGATTVLSPIRIDPVEGVSNPAIVRNSVVLPHPEGPTTVSSSPGATWRSTSLTAVTFPAPFPKLVVRLAISSTMPVYTQGGPYLNAYVEYRYTTYAPALGWKACG